MKLFKKLHIVIMFLSLVMNLSFGEDIKLQKENLFKPMIEVNKHNLKYADIDNQDRLFSITNKEVQIIDSNTGKIIKRYKHNFYDSSMSHTPNDGFMKMSHNGKYLAVHDANYPNYSVYIYNIENGKLLYKIKTAIKEWPTIYNICGNMLFTYDDKYLITIGYKGYEIIDVNNGTIYKIKKFPFTPQKISKNFLLSPNYKSMTFTNGDKIYIVDLNTDVVKRIIPQKNALIRKLVYFNGKKIIYVKNYNVLEELDITTGNKKEILHDDKRKLYDATLFSNNLYILNFYPTHKTIFVYDAHQDKFLSRDLMVNIEYTKPNSTNNKLLVYEWLDNKYYIWDMYPYNKELAQKIYDKIDKNSSIALYQYIKSFSPKLNIVNKALIDLKSQIEKNDNINEMNYLINDINILDKSTRDYLYSSLMERKKLLEDREQKNIFEQITQKNTINGYLWFINNYKSSKYSSDATKKLYEIINKENSIVAYDWFLTNSLINTSPEASKAYKEKEKLIFNKVKELDSITAYGHFVSSYPSSESVSFAKNKIYEILLKKAKKINTVEAYNKFIFACPLAPQVKEANKLAYDLEKDKYTDIGLLGFIGKDEKLNKQARKLLIKAKKIMQLATSKEEFLTFRNLGYFIVVGRMYDLARKELGNTDAVLTLQERVNIDNFISRYKTFIQQIKESNKVESGINIKIIDLISEVFQENLYKNKEIEGFIKNNGREKFKQLLAKDDNASKALLATIKQEINKKREKNLAKLQEEIKNFKTLYKQLINNYKPIAPKIENMHLGSDDSSSDTSMKKSIEHNQASYNTTNKTTTDYGSNNFNKETKEHLSSNKMKMDVKYEISGNKVYFKISAENLYDNAAGGISVSIPALKYDKDIYSLNQSGFDSAKIYPSGSSLWSGSLKRKITSSYVLIEGWSNKWHRNTQKSLEFSINKDLIANKTLNIRAVLVKNKQEYLLPTSGATDQQGYPVKQITVNVASGSNSVSSENKQNYESTQNSSDKVALEQVLNSWNSVMNNKDTSRLEYLYASEIKYYGKHYSRTNAIKDKQRALSKYPEFSQQIKNISYEEITQNLYKISFDKYIKASSTSPEKLYPSYLYIKKINNEWRIVEEGDKVTDRILQEKSSNNTSKGLFVCYDKKEVAASGINYIGCQRYTNACSSNGKLHFGKYKNSSDAQDALGRCENSKPKFIDSGKSGSSGGNYYIARISIRDHYNKRGNRLRKVADILQQERANFYKYGIRDSEDMADNYFFKKENRFKIKRMLQNGYISGDTAYQIINGVPVVKVEINGNAINVSLVNDNNIVNKDISKLDINTLYKFGKKYWDPPRGRKDVERAKSSQKNFIAKKYFKTGCKKGDMRACSMLSLFYRSGWGGNKDYYKAVKYAKLTCKRGNTRGCLELALAYLKGWGGVQKNKAKSLSMYKNMCKKGVKFACKMYKKFKSNKPKKSYKHTKKSFDKITKIGYLMWQDDGSKIKRNWYGAKKIL